MAHGRVSVGSPCSCTLSMTTFIRQKVNDGKGNLYSTKKTYQKLQLITLQHSND